MGLTEYKKKRSFTDTPEPKGGKGTGKTLRFVVQKHDASHLHYDFRLEMEGVLKSWAIPKGPAMDPEIKRLAVMVEDHPYDYRDFEGIIPKGQYGGGTVMVWDEGTYTPFEPESEDLKTQEKQLLHQFHSGKLKFILSGKKLKGAFALIKAYGKGENTWLLMKLEDKYAQTEDILLKDKSVLSRKSIAQIEKHPDQVYGKTKHPKAKPTAPKAEKVKKDLKTKAQSNQPAGNSFQSLVKKGVKTPFFDQLKPMLATLVKEAFDEPGWWYEVKWDGYRALAFLNDSRAELKSRNDQPFNERFYPIYQELKAWGINAIMDGELVVLNEKGTADFGALQNWHSEADGTLRYYVFDLLWYDGFDLRGLSLVDRKAILAELVPDQSSVILSKDFETSGIDFLDAAKRAGLEGVIAKRKDSQYHTGNRTLDWLKIKSNQRQEVVIGGFTKNEGSPKPFSSLLVGVFEKEKFIYTGKIGTGFSLKTQKELLAQFQPLIVAESPFATQPDVNKANPFRYQSLNAIATWLKPELICEVSFTEMTTDGLMRHPTFEGMRSDKNPEEVLLERAVPRDQVIDKNTMETKNKKKGDTLKKEKTSKSSPKARGKKGAEILLEPEEENQLKVVNGHSLKFTNLDKIFWPLEKVSKRDMINYYHQAAPFILPYLVDRPQSLNRYPNGITGGSFYQKDVTGKVPEWIKTYLYHAEGEDTDKHFLVADQEASLLYMANLGCIELHPWSSTVQKPEHPTWCIIDLDPGKNTFEQVIEAAQVTKAVLDDMGVPSYCKTSGSTGLHIYIPMGNKYTYEQSKEFARIIVTLVNRELPKFTSLERAVAKRRGKMYLDFLQNRPQATIAAPYALRPKPGATVSMPLDWEEVKKGLQMKDFTIFNAVARMHEMGDIFSPVLGKGIDLMAIIKNNKSEDLLLE